MKVFGDLLFIFGPILISIFLAICCGKNTGLLCYGIYSILMLYNISMTSLTNMIAKIPINTFSDVFWKSFFIMAASICLSLSLI